MTCGRKCRCKHQLTKVAYWQITSGKIQHYTRLHKLGQKPNECFYHSMTSECSEEVSIMSQKMLKRVLIFDGGWGQVTGGKSTTVYFGLLVVVAKRWGVWSHYPAAVWIRKGQARGWSVSLETGVLPLLGQDGVNCVQNRTERPQTWIFPTPCSTVGLKRCGLTLSHVPLSENEGIREEDERKEERGEEESRMGRERGRKRGRRWELQARYKGTFRFMS